MTWGKLIESRQTTQQVAIWKRVKGWQQHNAPLCAHICLAGSMTWNLNGDAVRQLGQKNILCDGHAPQTKHQSRELHTLGGLSFSSGWVADKLGQPCRIPIWFWSWPRLQPCMRHRFLAKRDLKNQAGTAAWLSGFWGSYYLIQRNKQFQFPAPSSPSMRLWPFVPIFLAIIGGFNRSRCGS